MAKRYFLWDDVNDCVLEERDENDKVIVTYTHEPGPFGKLISETRDGTTYTHHYDAVGSTTMLTNDAGDVTDTFAYDAWGNQVARTGTTPTPYTWCGRWGYQDDSATTGGYYVRERPYDPAVARWMSVDPLIVVFGLSAVAQGELLQLYAYAGNSPPRLIDPSGLECEPCSYCGPDADALLVAEINYAIKFWASHISGHASSLLRWTWYRAVVRWRHMLQIGPQLDWENLRSSNFKNCETSSCPTKDCARTYRICKRCVHDHFIGNLMFGLWTKGSRQNKLT